MDAPPARAPGRSAPARPRSDSNWPGFTGGQPWPTLWRLSFERVLAAGELTEQEARSGLAALTDPDCHDCGIATIAAWGRLP